MLSNVDLHFYLYTFLSKYTSSIGATCKLQNISFSPFSDDTKAAAYLCYLLKCSKPNTMSNL